MEIRKNLKWAVVFLLIIAASVCALLIHRAMPKTAKTAQIIQNGEVIKTISLDVDEPYEFEIASDDGAYNTIRVENGKIGVIDADCPDKICVRQGFITDGTLPIVCLPHRLSVVITNDTDIDAVSGR